MKFSRLLLFTLVFLLAWSFISPKERSVTGDDIILNIDSEIPVGKDPILIIQNHSDQILTIPTSCPENPLLVESYRNGEWEEIKGETGLANCSPEAIVIPSGESHTISYAPWNRDLFNQIGRYRVTLNTTLHEEVKTYSKEITVEKPGIFRMIWSELFYRPILNTLIFLISAVAQGDLGWGIILLTILIKIILLAPNHKALKAQKQLQIVQPQLDALKKKYEKDPQRLAQETMLIWKKYKVSPMSSCLPLMIQFPVLIALFYVVKDGMTFIHPNMLYEGLRSFDTTLINPDFLGIIDLTKINIYVLPAAIGLLQFYQMKLAMGITLKKDQPTTSPMPMMNKTMLYFMPLMIAGFTATMPGAVGFYWGTSTLFGIAQQFFVNKSKD